jgi:menaquinone-9 beta-reductase
VTLPGGQTDVFVIGGGPAGLAVAIAAKARGFSVAVADGTEPPIDKACGEGMMPATLAGLRELGVELPAGVGCRLRGIRFVEKDTQITAEFPDGPGMGIPRTVLHSLLIQKAEQCGVKLLWKTPVVGLEGDRVIGTNGTVSARWIVGADGTQSRVRRWSKLDSAITKQHRLAIRRHYRLQPWTEFTEVHWGTRMQAYVTPVADDRVCIVTMGELAEHPDFDLALRAVPKLRARLAHAELCGRERGAVSAMQSLTRVWRGNVALVGDASGGVDAITGEGLRLAFGQAQSLAEAMRAGDLREYGRAHRRLARRPRQMSKLMLQFGRNDRVRSRMLSMLRWNPELFARLLAIHAGQVTARDVLVMGTRLAWQYLAS